MRLTDRVSVMRLGEMVANFETAKTSPPELADAMVGRKVILRIEKGAAHPGEIALEARNLVVRDDRGVTRVDDVSFILRRGEIVGIAGVAGNRQSGAGGAGGHPSLTAIRGENLAQAAVALSSIEERPKGMRTLGVSHVPEKIAIEWVW